MVLVNAYEDTCKRPNITRPGANVDERFEPTLPVPDRVHPFEPHHVPTWAKTGTSPL